jgi:hypothetical protein
MNKYAQLLDNIDKYSEAAHRQYSFIKTAADSAELLAKADSYDIRDEQLFEQFEKFVEYYGKIINKIESIPADKREALKFDDSDDNLSDLYTEAFTKYFQKLINNPYLDMEKTGWDEDFDPGEFTNLIIEMGKDAHQKIAKVLGDDFIEEAEMNLQKEFVAKEDQRDGNLRWTGDKGQQAQEAYQRRKEELAFAKKQNPDDPRLIAMKQARTRYYLNLKNDPERLDHSRNKTRERGKRHREKHKDVTESRKALRTLKNLVTDPTEKRQIEESLQQSLHPVIEKGKQKATKVREKKESGTLPGLITTLRHAINTAKSTAKQRLTDKIMSEVQANNGQVLAQFQHFKDQYKEAFIRDDKQAMVQVIHALRESLNAYADSDSGIIEVSSKLNPIKEWKDKLGVVITNKWLEPEHLSLSRDSIIDLVNEGKSIQQAYEKEKGFGAIAGWIAKINNYLIERIK